MSQTDTPTPDELDAARLRFRNQMSLIRQVGWLGNVKPLAKRNGLAINATCFLHPSELPGEFPLFVNGRRAKTLSVAENVPLKILEGIPGISICRASCEIEGSAEELFPDGFAEITFRPYGQTSEQTRRSALYFRDPAREADIPEEDNVERVIGARNLHGFIMTGATAYMRVCKYMEKELNRPLATLPRILDWGCGAGRLTRYFSSNSDLQVTGADIDAVNIGWCKDHLKNARFQQIPLMPPMPFTDHEFDFAIGVSVFTHLKEPEQNAWLAELRRVVKPGGILMMSYHGPTVLAFTQTPGKTVAEIEEKGFLVTGNNKQIDGIGDDDYYVNVSQSRRYIEDVWGSHFEILDILPAFFNRQDVVVMQAR